MSTNNLGSIGGGSVGAIYQSLLFLLTTNCIPDTDKIIYVIIMAVIGAAVGWIVQHIFNWCFYNIKKSKKIIKRRRML